MHFVLNNAVVQLCWVVADMYEKQLYIGVIAATQDCCQPVLRCDTEQEGMRFVLSSAAVHCCWVTAYLYEQQSCIGVIAVTHDCCQPVLRSSTEH